MASLPCAREPTPCYRYYAVYQTNSLSNRVRALEHIVFRSPAHSGCAATERWLCAADPGSIEQRDVVPDERKLALVLGGGARSVRPAAQDMALLLLQAPSADLRTSPPRLVAAGAV